MFNIGEIRRNHRATFYNFESQKIEGRWFYGTLVIFSSAVAAVIAPDVSANLLAGVLAVQSILLGFAFNVMFFLLGNREISESNFGSIEEQLRSERLSKLYIELFYNVSYFNLIAISSIIIATFLLLPSPEVPIFLKDVEIVKAYIKWLDVSSIPEVGIAATHGCAMFLFYITLIEAGFTFARVVGRTSFYFERKMMT